jgi:Holliday junction resolvase RusA-like endonuclease
MGLRGMTEFVVLGPPATKGSTVSFMGKRGIVTKTDSTGLGGWTQAVGWAAKAARVPYSPRPQAVKVSAWFQFQRPAGAKRRPFPSVRPDGDKLARALLDALSGVAYEDDAQVVELQVFKQYGQDARTVVRVEGIDG